MTNDVVLTPVAVVSTSASAVVGVGGDLPPDYGDVFPQPDPSERRRAGVVLHPTSFRGPHGIGDFGEEAFRFIDWLHEAGCSLWQVLPLVPPGRKGNEEGSPYSGQVKLYLPICFLFIFLSKLTQLLIYLYNIYTHSLDFICEFCKA